jgi:hypothetical protein
MSDNTAESSHDVVVKLSLNVDDENVIEGSKAIISQIRQFWQIEDVKFKVRYFSCECAQHNIIF